MEQSGDAFLTSEISDEDLVIASQELESALATIKDYENRGQVLNLPVTHSPGGTLSLSKSTFEPKSLFNGCTFNQPVNIIFKQ